MPSRNPRALPPGLDPKGVPDHVAIVMDGNGRWAGAKGLPRNKGHEAGEAALFDTVEGGLDAGLSWLTVYAFSTENWRRPASEVRFLMNFNESLLVRRSHELHEREVRIRFIGRRDRIPPHVRRRIEEAEDLTAGDTRMTLAVALDYGGRDELARAVQALATEVREGRAPRRIDERAIARHLYAPDMPDVDLLIRTSNEYRISNFLLWQIAYAELHFTPVLWPDFNRHELFEALRIYQGRHRRFGAVADPATPAPDPSTVEPTGSRPDAASGPRPDTAPGSRVQPARSRVEPTRFRAGSPTEAAPAEVEAAVRPPVQIQSPWAPGGGA
jgi:undecaprenyl diphosphate synthase